MNPRSTWRLIMHPGAGGAANMAIDEAMLLALLAGEAPPTLRFYRWSAPCLNLGRSQGLADVDLAACQAAGVDVVRRVTGGQAVLNADELSYAVALRQDDPLAAGGILGSYRRLSEGLLAGLRRLGVAAEAASGRRSAGAARSPVCFEHLSDYEIVVDGRKLVGSSQWRSRGGLLQHGTLPLRGDLTRIALYLSLPSDDARETQRCTLRSCATTLEETLGHALPFDDVARVLADGFAEALNLDLRPGDLTPYEWDLADRLSRTRYGSLQQAGGQTLIPSAQ